VLPPSTRKVAIQVAIDTGATRGIDTEMATDNDAWEDMQDFEASIGHEGDVEPSHEGGEYFHFVNMAQDALNGRQVNLTFFLHDLFLLIYKYSDPLNILRGHMVNVWPTNDRSGTSRCLNFSTPT
jgi:hypothetical protein